MVFMIGIDRQWAGAYLSISRVAFRLCLGFVAFTIMRAGDDYLLDALREKVDSEFDDMPLDVDLLDQEGYH